MRSTTAALIFLGLGCLSCGGVSPFSASGAAHRGSDAALAGFEHEVRPRHFDADRFDGVTAQALERRQEGEIFAALMDRHTGLARHELQHLASTIVAESERHGLDPSLVLAVIQVESGGYHLAVSPVGALGLMQLLPSTAEEVAQKHGHHWRGANSLFDPILNVKLGTAYLRQLESKYGSIDTALAAYNWGPGRIDRRLRRGAAVPSVYPGQVMKFYEAGGRVASRS